MNQWNYAHRDVSNPVDIGGSEGSLPHLDFSYVPVRQ